MHGFLGGGRGGWAMKTTVVWCVCEHLEKKVADTGPQLKDWKLAMPQLDLCMREV